MTQNVPQFIDFKKCFSGSWIPGSQFFAGLATITTMTKTPTKIKRGKKIYSMEFPFYI